ncbi:putative harbinger transposase-derived nuclease domain-containing protein [Medicago truncatula]|uniref:Putative harbinger transposase-derived nuclease domain-containing protein n=1 Tax=Medicago truncatula TaxID=3880 RepID=A0A396IH57_MEDTR|nr:putative harbinger transposase-derived nuclease domain-containing protein [Medicago truncatula]
MESRKLAALLSSLVSQLLLILLLIFPPNSFPPNSLPPNSTETFSLIHHFLFSQQTAVTTTLLSRKRKRYHHRLIPNPDWFPTTFLMTSSTFEWLTNLLEPLLECRDPAYLLPLNLTAGVRLGIGLFRLASGSDYQQIANQFNVTVSVAKFCVKQLCRVLCTNFRFWVSFPNANDRSILQNFESISGLPNCSGVVFSSRFQIAPSTSPQQPHSSIAAQIVVDSTCRILSIAAGYFGHKTDYTILKASSLFNDIEEGSLLNAPSVNGVNQYLIGDSGYPLLPWLMVPFADNVCVTGSVEETFNAAHGLMRIPAFKTDASLRKWGVLSKPVREEIKMAVAYIGACSILHNSLLMREDFSALVSDFEYQRKSVDPFVLEDDPVKTSKALAMRATLATMAKKIS